MSSVMPRLLTEEQARTFLGGAAPGSLLPPLRLGRRKLWDMEALKQRLDELSGLSGDSDVDRLSELERWEQSHGSTQS